MSVCLSFFLSIFLFALEGVSSCVGLRLGHLSASSSPLHALPHRSALAAHPSQGREHYGSRLASAGGVRGSSSGSCCWYATKYYAMYSIVQYSIVQHSVTQLFPESHSTPLIILPLVLFFSLHCFLVAGFRSFQNLIRSVRNARAEYNVAPAKKIAALVRLSSTSASSAVFSELLKTEGQLTVTYHHASCM